jgi:purine nucleoside phosphorylase
MTPDDVIGEFMRSAPYIDGVAQTHYLDANAMAAEIVRLRAQIAAVLALPTVNENCYAVTSGGVVGDLETNAEYVRTDLVTLALGLQR